MVFGFSYQNAGQLVEFLKTHRHDLRQVTGVRYSGELGHPFHVVDDDTVVLPLDHPFRKMESVVITPHLGYVSEQNYRKYFPDIVEDIRAWLDGKPVRTIS